MHADDRAIFFNVQVRVDQGLPQGYKYSGYLFGLKFLNDENQLLKNKLTVHFF